ncbi:MAG: transposase [Defluviitaleaceae bacterium]|nr:transposase [Defluviitaleaceae bacterium]
MILTSQTIIKTSSEFFDMFDEFCFKAKNLYNTVLYKLRQDYFANNLPVRQAGARNNYYDMDKRLKQESSLDYAQMPMAASAQWTVKSVFQNWQSFWNALTAYNDNPKRFSGRPKMPYYLHKTKGRAVINLTNQSVKVKAGVLHFPKSFKGFSIPLNNGISTIKHVRIVPKNRHFVVEIIYEIGDVPLKEDNLRYLGIDLGLDNFATVVSNEGSSPVLINGKGLKSLNKYWNKRISHLREVETAMNGYEISTKTGKATVSNQTKQQTILTNKRNNQVKDFCHKASKMIVDLALKRGCNTIIIGKNDGWKQESNMSKKVNQSFVQIPHAAFINMLEYKCQKYGLNFVKTEESYTSKTSWLDNELPIRHENYLGKRINRGLFRSAPCPSGRRVGKLINADVNGALQIVKKVFPNAKGYGIWACGQPLPVVVV